MVIEVGKLAGNAIVPYSQSTKRTKEITLTATTVDGSTISLQEIIGYAYADSADKWWLEVTGRITITTTEANLKFTLSGIQVRNIVNSVNSYWTTGTAAGNVGIAGGVYSFEHDHATTPSWIQLTPASSQSTFAFDSRIPLESKPTWADANMEASTQADIYVEPASATQSGLVNTSAQSFAGLKDFTQGVDVTAVDGSFYRTQTLDVAGSGDYTVGSVICSRVGNQVVISSTSTLTHSSVNKASSASLFIPAAYRPATTNTYNVYIVSTEIARCAILNDGTMETQYYKWDGTAGTNRIDSFVPITISYNV